jgi:hypothetical protein
VLTVLVHENHSSPNQSCVQEDEGHVPGGQGDALRQVVVENKARVTVRVTQDA